MPFCCAHPGQRRERERERDQTQIHGYDETTRKNNRFLCLCSTNIINDNTIASIAMAVIELYTCLCIYLSLWATVNYHSFFKIKSWYITFPWERFRALEKPMEHSRTPPPSVSPKSTVNSRIWTLPSSKPPITSRHLQRNDMLEVAIKVVIVIHRTLREGDPTFREELLNYSHRGHILQISNFKDDSSPLAWDCSAWVRTYALFLEERLECFRILKYDIEAERLTRPSPGASKVHSRTRLLSCDELLEQLPALQQLLYRLIGCQPEGVACCNYLVQYALALVLKESFKIYCAINDGIINLVDMYFDMSKHDAVKALNVYKRAGRQAEYLADFYEFCKRLDLARNFQFPTLRQPPPSFLVTMEEYVKEAPQTGSLSKTIEYREISESPRKPEDEEEKLAEEEEEEVEQQKPPQETKEELQPPMIEAEPPPSPPLIDTGAGEDLLGLHGDGVNQKAAELEETNALALSIVPSGSDSQSLTNRGWTDLIGTGGWELALVTTPSTSTSISQAVPENNLAGGFNKLLLDSLYEDESARRQIQLHNAGYGYGQGYGMQNPFEQQDPFAISNTIIPQPPSVQMAIMAQQQQQQQIFQHQQLYQHQHPQPMGSSFNPFGVPFAGLTQNTMPQHGNQGLL
ncbi:hypothetical protein Dimus_025680 [Dionaea muscipula]